MVSRLAMSWCTSWFGKHVLVLVTQLEPMSLLNKVMTPLRYLNPKSSTNQWGSGPWL